MLSIAWLLSALIMSGLNHAAPIASSADAIYNSVPDTTASAEVNKKTVDPEFWKRGAISNTHHHSIPDTTASAEVTKKTVHPEFWKKYAMPFTHPVTPIMERHLPPTAELERKTIDPEFWKKTVMPLPSTATATNFKPKDVEDWDQEVGKSEPANKKPRDTEFW